MRCLPTAILSVAVVLGPNAARADVDYFAKQSQVDAVTVTRETSRTTREQVILWSLVGAGAVTIGLGVRWHLESRDAADAVSSDAVDPDTAWTDELMATYDDASRYGTRATIAYAAGAALLAGAFGWAYYTRPRERQVVLVPVERGAAAGARWSF